MSRFEIEDIISQDKRGIVFRAHDAEKGHTVALRRFFPFGQDGGGLSAEESLAFRIAAQRLEGISHVSLRTVIAASVDPIDGMPYVVAEWIDGVTLDAIVDGGTLDPPHIIELLRLALEVSLLLSDALGEEAVWVETEADSIFVGSEESCRGFVFWLSPFKWLGAEFGSRKLAVLVELGERLAGWKGKFVGDNAGNGLGAWLKWMKTNPDAGLTQALDVLATLVSEGDASPQTQPTRPDSPIIHPAVKVKTPSAISPLMIAACTVLLIAVTALTYLHRTAKAPVILPNYTQQEISPPKPAAPAATQPTTGEPAAITNPDEEIISATDISELAAKLAHEKELQRTAAKASPATESQTSPIAPPQRDFTPPDGEKMKELKANGPATLTGVVRSVSLSASGKSLYFNFSDPLNQTEIKAVAHKSNYQGEATPQSYADLLGKRVRFEGTVFREPNGRQFVKISSRNKLKVVE